MEKLEYLKSSFVNIQELIKFTDQKIASVLVLCGIEITIFFELSKNTIIIKNNLSLQSIITFLSGIVFLTLLFIIIYLSIMRILKPRFARHYNADQYSLIYFEHIALNDKTVLFDNIEKLNKNDKIQEFADQLYEVSKILYRKNKYCSIVMQLLFYKIISLIIYAFSMRI